MMKRYDDVKERSREYSGDFGMYLEVMLMLLTIDQHSCSSLMSLQPAGFRP